MGKFLSKCSSARTLKIAGDYPEPLDFGSSSRKADCPGDLPAKSAAAWLGIDMPAVANGDAGFVVLGTSLSGGPKAKSAAADEQAGAFVVTTAQPRRVTGSFKFTAEDAARLDGMESALTMNLSSVLSDALDNQAINGSGSGDGSINGLFNRLSDPSAPATGQETLSLVT